MSSPDADGPVTVLVGAAGTATGFGVVRTLRNRWPEDVTVIAVDINRRELVAAAALSNLYLQSPKVADAGYAEWLLARLEDSDADLYVPLLDSDVLVAAELAEDERLAPGSRVAAPPVGSARVCLDKLETFRWLDANGISACRTWLPAEAVWNPRGLVAKPRHGVGSKGIAWLRSEDELERARNEDSLVVQERCDAPEVTIDAFLASDDATFRAICRERLETKAGVCTKARVFESEELAALAEQVVRGLLLRGGSCLQVMRAADGSWCFTDVNARPGGGTPLSTVAGVDILGASYADLLGLPFDTTEVIGPLKEDVYAVRQYHEYVV